ERAAERIGIALFEQRVQRAAEERELDELLFLNDKFLLQLGVGDASFVLRNLENRCELRIRVLQLSQQRFVLTAQRIGVRGSNRILFHGHANPSTHCRCSASTSFVCCAASKDSKRRRASARA